MDGEKEGGEDVVKKDHQEAPPAPGVDANQAHQVILITQLYTETFLNHNRYQKTWNFAYSEGEP